MRHAPTLAILVLVAAVALCLILPAIQSATDQMGGMP